MTRTARTGAIGELALRARLALDDARLSAGSRERYAKCFAGGWYLTGDLAMRDSDGYYWFVGRADDLIKSSGHLIGPFEVESALIEHPAVAEAAVIGIPDETAGEVVKAFVTLKAGFTRPTRRWSANPRPCPQTPWPRRRPARNRVSRQPARTRSGKIMRRLLRRANSACPRAIFPRWRGMSDDHAPKPKLDA